MIPRTSRAISVSLYNQINNIKVAMVYINFMIELLIIIDSFQIIT